VANYKPGDKIVCIDSRSVVSHLDTILIKAGNTYTCRALGTCCGTEFTGLHEVDISPFEPHCIKCHNPLPQKVSHFAWRFVKLDKLLTEHEESEKEETTA